MESYCGIPVVDLDESLEEDEVSKSLVSALEDVGFAYVKNTGITQHQVNEAFSKSAQFFDLPLDVKMKYKFPVVENKPGRGFVPPENERFSDDKPVDIKEALDLAKGEDALLLPLNEHIPGFMDSVKEFENNLKTLAYRLLHLVGKGLRLEDSNLLKELFEGGDDSLFRMVDYPKIPDMSGLKRGQLRCSEHSDYGGLTVLFQDDCGGLEVMNREGSYVEAVPLADTALVNVGDFFAMCTNGKLKATLHRVLISEKNFDKRRQSLVYFFDPDGTKMVQPPAAADCGGLGSDPISYNMWRNQRYRETKVIA